MNTIRYHDLNEIQRNALCNGCGGKGGLINPPEFLFNASCNQHDFYYWRGGTEEDRKKADNDFYEFMKQDAEAVNNWLKRKTYRLIAWTYYKAVRIHGKKFFYYSTKQRDIADLHVILAIS